MRGHLLDSLVSLRRVALLAALAGPLGCGSSDGPQPPDAAPACEPSTLPEAALPAGVHIVFPPAQSLTDADVITVRGTALLDGDVAAIRVNGVAAESADGFRHWQASVPLVPGENAITVESEDGAGQVDPGAAQATIVSAPHPMFEPVAVILDAPRNRALVAEHATSTVLAVDLATGLRTPVYEHPVEPFARPAVAPYIPPPSAFPLLDMIALDDERVLVASYSELFAVDLATGERTEVSGQEVGNGPAPQVVVDMALDAERGRVLGLELVTETLMAVDLSTGDRTIIADFTPTSGFRFAVLTALVIDAEAGRALVVRGLDLEPPALLAVDLTTGESTELSGEDQGSGPVLQTPDDMVLDAANNRVLLVDSGHRAVIAIDLATGDRTILADTATENGPQLVPIAIALDAQQGRALLTDPERRSLYAVDLETAQLTRISDDVIGSGDALRAPSSIALDAPAGRVLVGDPGGSALVAVDLATGARAVLSSDATGDGPGLGNLSSLAIDARRQRALVTNGPGDVLVAVDLASGQRTALASFEDGKEPSVARPQLVTMDEAGDRAILSTMTGELMTVDLATGDRVLLSEDVELVAWQSVQSECSRMLLVTYAGASGALTALDLGSGQLTRVIGYDACPVFVESLEYPAYDPRSAQVLSWTEGSTSLVAMDTRTGACTEVADIRLDRNGPVSAGRGPMVVDPSTGLLLMAAYPSKAVLAIDPETAQRVIVSR